MRKWRKEERQEGEVVFIEVGTGESINQDTSKNKMCREVATVGKGKGCEKSRINLLVGIKGLILSDFQALMQPQCSSLVTEQIARGGPGDCPPPQRMQCIPCLHGFVSTENFDRMGFLKII